MASKPPTAIVMMNMGGPSSLDEVQPFLTRLFTDHQIMQMPFQSTIGQMIAKRRSPKIRDQYAEIGGRSPIAQWTEVETPEFACKKPYVCFKQQGRCATLYLTL